MKKCLLGYCQLSEIILLVKLQGNLFNLFIIVVYALTEEEETDKFYNTIDNVKTQCKLQEITIIRKDLNAEMEKEQNSNKISDKF